MNKLTTILFMLFLFCSNLYSGGGSTTIFVDSSKPDDTGNGLSWANAKQTLQAGLNLAVSGDQIWVKAGTYKPTTEVGGSGDRFKTFQMKNGVKIYGGFDGNENPNTFNLDDRDFQTNETILNGDLLGNDSYTDIPACLTDNCYHIFYHPNGSNIDETAILDGFTVKNGNADGGSGFTNGAGMFNYNSSPTINNVIFKDNYASVSGGAINLVNSNSAISNTTFSNNSAVNGGGAVTIEGGGSPAFTDCSFNSNIVSSGSGGAIYVTASTPTFQYCTFESNSASSLGGAFLCVSGGNPELTSCTLTSNNAPNGGAFGIQTSSSVFVSSTVLNSNYASEASSGAGGAFFVDNGCSVELNNSRLSANSSTTYGGAFLLQPSATAKVTNSTIVNNNSSYGGGFYHNGSSLAINNSILWGNNTTQWGNQIETSGGSGVVLNYSCFENDYTDGDWDVEGSVTANNCININPRLVDVTNADFRILGASPCVDAGDNSYIEAPNTVLTEDIREQNRIVNTTVDMGCFEYSATLDPLSKRYYVNDNASGSDNGTSWTNAFMTLQQALDVALDKDSIFVAAGNYYPSKYYNLNNSDERNKHFRMIEGVSIFGCFYGNEDIDTYNFNDRNLAANASVLSGDIGVLSDSTDNCYHIFYHPSGLNLTSAAIIDGFEITKGNAGGTDDFKDGGAMFNSNNSPSLKNIKFSRNTASDRGGAIYNTNSSPSLFRVLFTQNYADTDGGAMFNNDASSPQIISSAFSQNSSQYSGGAVYTKESSNPAFINCLFVFNQAIYGGASLNQSTVTFTNCTFSENYAYQGGGISAEGDLTINNSIIWSNDGVDGKQLYIKSGTTTTINYSDYSNGTGDISQAGTLAGANNINLNPKFKNPLEGNFSILGISPCADAGSNALFNDSWTTNDIRDIGFPRKINKDDYTQAGTIDMGAYEFNSNSDLSCQAEVWVSSDYGLNTPNWQLTYFDDLEDALNVACTDATVNISNYSHTGDVDMTGRTFIIGAQDFVLDGELTGGVIRTIGTGYLSLTPSQNTQITFPVTDGTNNETIKITCLNNPSQNIKVRIKNDQSITGGLTDPMDIIDIRGENNMNATIVFRIDKAQIAPKTIRTNTVLRWYNGTNYVLFPQENVSISEFDTYYEITVTGINQFSHE